MGQHEIVMPDIGEGVTEAEIIGWSVKVGDLVREDDLVAEVMTDKATVEIPSPVDGIVTAISGDIGEIIPVGTVIITLDTSPDEYVPQQATESADTELDAETSPPSQAKAGDQPAPAIGKPIAAPAVRRRAEDAGIDLATVTGSGPDGRITIADLEKWLSIQHSSATGKPVSPPGADGKEIKVIGLRRMIAEHMEASTRRIAQMTYVEEIDVTEMEAMRENLNSDLAADKTRLTVLPFLMIAIIRALRENPKLNAHFDDEAGLIRQFDSIHMGMATQTSAGLMVPVISSAETLDIWGLAVEIKRLAEAAKSGSINREELIGSTITLSSLGAMGGLVSTPIVNSPEVAIVGVNKIAMRQVWHDDAFVARKIMNISSSFDHRVVDGWDAAKFIQDVKSQIERPATLLNDA